jgi:hypothetical protein
MRILCWRFLFCLAALTSACSNELDIAAEWRDVPVVYGFLSRQDTAHYLRVEKGFLPRDTEASAVAQIADSLYYSDATVQLERLRDGRRFTLLRVDGALEGYPRREGPFAQSPNYLYKIRASDIQLQEGERIRFLLFREDGREPVTAETTVLPDIIPRETIPRNPVSMGYDRQVVFAWSTGPAARIFDVSLFIHYRESLPGSSDTFFPKTAVWTLTDDMPRPLNDDRLEWPILGESFYRFLAEALEARPDVLRVFDSMDVRITGAGEELAEFLRVGGANLGITSFQSPPSYSNLSEGRGIFSSRASAVRRGLTLDAVSLDSLRDGIHTRRLNFR